MARWLHRIGKWSFRHARRVVLCWVLVLGAVGAGALTLSGPTDDRFSIPGIESAKALTLLNDRFPKGAADGAQARVVFEAPAGHTISEPGYARTVRAVAGTLGALPSVLSAPDPFTTQAISRDQRMAMVQVQYRKVATELSAADRTALLAAPESARAAGLTVGIGGDALRGTPATGSAEVLGVVVALLVLVLTFGSLLAAGLPLLTALLGVGIGVAGITAATGLVQLSSTTPVLGLMLGLAVGIDYALFIVSRYRNELQAGVGARDATDAGRTADPAFREEAAARAIGTAGSAVVFAGATVVIALVGLAVVGIPFLTSMGIAAAVMVSIAVVIALTLLPALLGLAGTWVVAGRIPGLKGPVQPSPDGTARPSAGFRWGRRVARHRWFVLPAAVLAAGAVAIPVASLHLALPDDSTAAPGSTQRVAYDLVAKGFGPGLNGPLLVVLDARGAHAASGITAAAARVGAAVRALPSVAAVLPASVNQAEDTAVLTVIPRTGPSDGTTKDLVRAIRAEAPSLRTGSGIVLSVTGRTALNIDVSAKLAAALPVYLLVVVGLAFLLLLIVFRSLLVPLTAVIGYLLSVGAALGAIVAVFQWGWLSSVLDVSQPAPVMSLLPILLVGIQFGLAMDYQVFLVSRMHEEHGHGRAAREAVVTGFGYGARVVASAAVIMVSVFAGFVFSQDIIIKSIGFGLAFGVLVDAFLIRMTAIPAVMAILGRAAWWVPRALDRVLPRVDVEGERLGPVTVPASAPVHVPETATALVDAPAAAAAFVPVPGSGLQSGADHVGARVPAARRPPAGVDAGAPGSGAGGHVATTGGAARTGTPGTTGGAATTGDAVTTRNPIPAGEGRTATGTGGAATG